MPSPLAPSAFFQLTVLPISAMLCVDLARGVHQLDRGGHVRQLLDRGELRHLTHEVLVVDRVHRVLVLQLRDEQLEEVVLAERSASPRPGRPGSVGARAGGGCGAVDAHRAPYARTSTAPVGSGRLDVSIVVWSERSNVCAWRWWPRPWLVLVGALLLLVLACADVEPVHDEALGLERAPELRRGALERLRGGMRLGEHVGRDAARVVAEADRDLAELGRVQRDVRLRCAVADGHAHDGARRLGRAARARSARAPAPRSRPARSRGDGLLRRRRGDGLAAAPAARP